MKSRNISIIVSLLLGCTFVFSQSESRWKAETATGYEYNYFKSPETILMDGVLLTKESLIASSVYQDIAIDYKYTYRSKKNSFRISLQPYARLFYETTDDSYWSLNARAAYKYAPGKKTVLSLEARFKRMAREGLGGNQDVLINPLGYSNYGTTASIELEPFRQNTLTVETFYNFKNFDAYGVRDLQFNELGVQLGTVQQFKVHKLKHEIGLRAYVKKRLYDTFNASEVITDGVRDWDYLNATLFYKLPLSKRLKISPDFVYYARRDNSTNRSGFHQYGPGLGLRYRGKSTRLRSTFSYITRMYSDIEARDNEPGIGENIQYKYVNAEFHATQRLGKHLSLTATLYSKLRNTNYTDVEARSFRSYRNQYAGLGVLWEF